MDNKTIKSILAKLTFLVLITSCIALYYQNMNLIKQIKVTEEKLEEVSRLNKFTISKMVNQNRNK